MRLFGLNMARPGRLGPVGGADYLWHASSLALPPGFTFTRSGAAQGLYGADYASAVYSSYATDTPRFERLADGRVGLLIEGARTNLLLRSAEFDNAAWTKSQSSVTGDGAVGLDGATTADVLVENSAAGVTHYITRAITLAAGTASCCSCWVKRSSGTRNFQIYLGAANAYRATFDLDALTATTSALGDGSVSGGGVIAYPNGWYRCWVAGVHSTTAANPSVFLNLVSGTSITYNGDGTSSLALWGAQAEAGAFPSSYIPTAASTVTRNAETCSRSVTLPSGGFTVVLDALLGPSPVGTSHCLWTVDDGSNNNRHALNWGTTGELSSETVAANVFQASNVSAVLSPYTRIRAAARYAANDFRMAVNGTLTALDSSGSLPSGITTERLGTRAGGANPCFSHILACNASPTVWRPPVSDVELQALSALT